MGAWSVRWGYKRLEADLTHEILVNLLWIVIDMWFMMRMMLPTGPANSWSCASRLSRCSRLHDSALGIIKRG